jgi:hypothetical protein
MAAIEYRVIQEEKGFTIRPVTAMVQSAEADKFVASYQDPVIPYFDTLEELAYFYCGLREAVQKPYPRG